MVSSYDLDEEYIDMEVSSYTSSISFFSREFEFHKSKLRELSTTSPADELFYKGKLLPLHLPPRLQMVENLLNDHPRPLQENADEFYATPLMTTATTPPITSTPPYESCNISPVESCEVSREVNARDYFDTQGIGTTGGDDKQRISWTKKLKLIKQSSRAYLRSLFGKSGCSDESCKVANEISASTANKHYYTKIPFGQIHRDNNNNNIKCSRISTTTFEKQNRNSYSSGLHRRSFSLAIKRHSKNISSSSSASSSSSSSFNNSNGMKFLKRSNSSNSSSEVENSIQGAIAYCKKSQQSYRARKTLSEIGIYSLSTE